MSHLDGLALAEKIRNSEITPTQLIEDAFKKIDQHETSFERDSMLFKLAIVDLLDLNESEITNFYPSFFDLNEDDGTMPVSLYPNLSYHYEISGEYYGVNISPVEKAEPIKILYDNVNLRQRLCKISGIKNAISLIQDLYFALRKE